MSVLIPNIWRTEILRSGRGAVSAAVSGMGGKFVASSRGAFRFRLDNANAGVAVPVLAESDRAQVVVGLDDLAQAVLGGAVAAVGVGVEELHQGFIARLDLGGAFGALKIEGG